MHALCLPYAIYEHRLCVTPLPVQVYLCKYVILVAFVTLFSWGVCVSGLIKVNPCEAAGAPLLCLSFCSPSTLPSLYHSIPGLLPPGSLTAQENMLPQGLTLPFWLPRVPFPWKQCQS